VAVAGDGIPERLVSLCPSLTETLVSLGLGERLVGRTKFCERPAHRIAAVPVVGGTKDPRIARIVALAPDLVLMNEEENRREDAEALRAAGLAVHTTFPRRVVEIPPLLRDLGARLGARRRAERIAAALEAASARAAQRAATRPPVRFLCLIWRDPWMGVGEGTYIDDLLQTVGGQNVLAGNPHRYPTLATEDLTGLRPDIVVLPDEPFPFRAAHVDELVVRTRMSPARFALTPGAFLSWHGVRSLSALGAASALLHP